MIPEALFRVVAFLVEGLLAVIPHSSILSGYVASFDDDLDTLAGWISAGGGWLPIGTLFAGLGLVVGTLAVAVGMRVVGMLIGLVTRGGYRP